MARLLGALGFFVSILFVMGVCMSVVNTAYAADRNNDLVIVQNTGNSAEIFGDDSFGIYYGDQDVVVNSDGATTVLDPRAVEAGARVMTVLILGLIILLIIAFFVGGSSS